MCVITTDYKAGCLLKPTLIPEENGASLICGQVDYKGFFLLPLLPCTWKCSELFSECGSK